VHETPINSTDRPSNARSAIEPLLTAPEIARMLQTSVRSIWRYLSAGKLPRPLTIGGRLKRWRRADIEEWLRRIKPHSST
jgi:excisionase family DNA binding protein